MTIIKLPELTKKRLRWVFDNVYETDMPPLFPKASTPAIDKKLLETLRSMQLDNFKHRTDECVDLFRLFNAPYFLETNSEGTTVFLAMALALKELYGLEDMELQRVVYGCH
jgi:hypothetical protein